MAVVVVGSLVLLVVVIVGWYFSHDAKVRRELRNAPVRKIAQLDDDQVGRIVGAARTHTDGTLTAPLTGRPCLYYIARVDVQRTTGETTTWRLLFKEERGVPFVVVDDTGRAIIDPFGAKISLQTDAKTKSGMLGDPSAREKEFLARHGESATGLLFNRALRYSEAIIEEHETIAVLGAGTREPDPDAAPTDAYRGDQPTLLRLTSSARYPLVISDASDTTRDS